MSQPAVQPLTIDEFFAWQDRQPVRYELLDGFPHRMMAGASRRHDRIVINILAELRARLRGSGCVPFSADGSVRTRPGQIRRPDAGIDCGQAGPDSLVAAEPRMVAEVLSPSTRDVDTFDKLAEYKAIETLDYILFVEPNEPQVIVWSRDEARTWGRSRAVTLDGAVEMPALGLTLPLAEIYDGVDVPDGPAPPGHWTRTEPA